MTQINKRQANKIFSIIIVVVILIILLPIKIPTTVKSYGKIYPSKELYVTKIQNESISTEFIDRLNSGIKEYHINSFERGDRASFIISPNIKIGSKVTVGDTIGRIKSSKLTQLQSELIDKIGVATANLNVFNSQKHQSLVDEAQYQIDYAQTQYENQKLIYDRNLQLYKENLISDEDFDSINTKLQLYEKEVKIAQAQLETVISGAKPETISFLRSEINSFQNKYNTLTKQINEGILISPINGIINNSTNKDTLFSIQDTTKYIASFPISLNHIKSIENNQEVKIKIPGDKNCLGIVKHIDNNVHMMGGDSRVIITVELIEKHNVIQNGKVVIGKFNSKGSTLLNRISQLFNNN